MKQTLFLIIITLMIFGCDSKNTHLVSDKEIQKDTLIPLKMEIKDTLPPEFDTTKFHNLTVECFFNLGVNTGGKVYYSKSRDNVHKIIKDVIVNHATKNSDIVFLIDNTGSMIDDIQNVKNNLNDIIDLLKTLDNLKVSVATYGDKNIDSVWYSRNDLSSNLKEMRTFINNIQPNGGGDFPESTYDALYKTVDELNWSSNSNRMVLLIGDAPGLEPPLTDHNRKETIEKCLDKNVRANIYPILINIYSDKKAKEIKM